MAKNRNQILFSVAISLIFVLILTTFFVPLLKFTAIDNETEQVAASGLYTFLSYMKEMVFLDTGAIHSFLSGPVWLAVLGVHLNIFVIIISIFALGFCVVHLCVKNENVIIKQNGLAKKFVLILGYFGVFAQIFSLIAFLITTSLANGYLVYTPFVELFLSLGISIALIVLGSLIKTTKSENEAKKNTSLTSFALTFFFSILGIVWLFIPQISEFVYGENLSAFRFSFLANELADAFAAGGDIALGVSQYMIFALILCCLFIAIYSLIGFIRVLKGKSVNFLSSRAKRWTFVYLLVYLIFYILQIGAICSLFTTTFLYENCLLLATFFIGIVAAFLPFIFARLLASLKKIDKKE